MGKYHHIVRFLYICCAVVLAGCATEFPPDDSDGDDAADTGGDNDAADVPDVCDDSDGDGVCDEDDVCPGGDDTIDTDGDTIPDYCDCEGLECGENAHCEDRSTGPECVCDDGYDGDGMECTDVDECADGTHTCHVNATCTNTEGGFDCDCNDGYSGSGISCFDIDECTLGTHTCHDDATCTNTDGSYECDCNMGFDGDGVTCTDIDECALGTHDCHPTLGVCTNTPGSWECACVPGYDGDGRTCTDIDECALGTDDCHPTLATCTNTPGSWTCACISGYSGDGRSCVDIDECALGTHGCHLYAICTNTPGSYTCACDSGFTGDGFTCTDIDECASGTHGCDAHATCTNTPGSYTCQCRMGWAGDGRTCDEVVGPGHAVLVGHDLYLSNADVDRIVGNAVLLANTTGDVRVLAYTEWADMSGFGEYINTDAAIDGRMTALGRTWTKDTLDDYTQIDTRLPGHHVLLVYEQERGVLATMQMVGRAWESILTRFVGSGGVVVVCDFTGGSWEIINSSGLMTITGGSLGTTGDAVAIVSPGDPVASEVSDPYIATSGTARYTTPEPGVVSAGLSPVVLHKSFGCNTYSEDFVRGVAPVAQCTSWNDWRASLPSSGLESVTMYGDHDMIGITCTDPTAVQGIADALRSYTTGSWTCDGHEWSLCARDGGELWIDPPSICSSTNCPSPGYIVRPCIGSLNWGGVNTATCMTQPDQMMGVRFCNSTGPVIFSEDFASGVSSNAQCTQWNVFRGQLTPTFSKLTIKGSNDEIGFTCSGPTADIICQALRTGTSGAWICDGQTWRVGECGPVDSWELNATDFSCTCASPGHLIRPCIDNLNWGGIATATCSPPSQRMDALCM